MVNFNYTSQEFWVSIETPTLFLFVHVFLPSIYLFTEHKYIRMAQVLSSNSSECSSIAVSHDHTVGWIRNSGLNMWQDSFQQSSYRVKLQWWSHESGPALVFMALLCDLPHIVSHCPLMASWESCKVTKTSSVLRWSRSYVNQRWEITNQLSPGTYGKQSWLLMELPKLLQAERWPAESTEKEWRVASCMKAVEEKLIPRLVLHLVC